MANALLPIRSNSLLEKTLVVNAKLINHKPRGLPKPEPTRAPSKE